jgi:acyl carrier protein
MPVANDEIVDSIVGFIRRRFPAESAAGADTRLLGGNAIDSLGVFELTVFLGEAYGIAIDEEDFSEENFETIGSVAQLVKSKLASAGA